MSREQHAVTKYITAHITDTNDGEIITVLDVHTAQYIVPVGSKGGFIVKTKTMADGREAFQAEGIACYQTFLRGMLDITDNIVDGTITPPANTVRHDEDDPYLVVAADKGTATFSDIANALAAEYNFWLDDAKNLNDRRSLR